MTRSIAVVLSLLAFAAIARADAPKVKSDACLSCHNGTKAPRMESSHPYAIRYADAIAQARRSKYKPPQAPSGFGSTIAQDLLVDGNIECNTCHRTHEDETDNPFRLRTRDVVKLCVACHVMR